MKFGYIPKYNNEKSKIWNAIYHFIYSIIGMPEYLRKLQAPLIFEYLDIKKKDKILDLGCGKGHFAYEIAKRADSVIAVDLILDKERTPQNELLNLSFTKGDARYLEIRNKSIDKILMSSFLQMIKEDELILDKCSKILKKDGILVLSVPTDYCYIPKLYYNNWICKKIRRLFNMPEKYKAFLFNLNKIFNVKGKGYYSLSYLNNLLSRKGFIIEKYEYCPKKIGSFIFEFFLLFIHLFPKKSRMFWISMILFYPLGLIDNIFFKKKKGCEIILKAYKI